MAKMRIKWLATPEQIRRAFATLETGLNDWSPAMVRIQQIFSTMFGKIFSSSGADLAGAWAPQAPETVRRRMRDGAGDASPATLHMSGVLQASLEGSGAGAIRRVVLPGRGVPRIEFGTSVPYAGIVQAGSEKRGMPARPFVGITDEAKGEIEEALQDHLARRMRETAEALGGGGGNRGR